MLEKNVDQTRTTIRIRVDGMTCGHCEKHVGDALRQLPGVSVVSVSRQDSAATVTVDGTPDLQALVAAVQAAGYSAGVDPAAGTLIPRAAP